MIGRLRIAVGLAAVAAATLPLALTQVVALRTGLIGEAAAPRLWHRLIVRVLGIRITAAGRLAEGRPLLIAANHVSWTDIMVLGAIADVHFIARADMARWPVLGRLATLQRTVFVDRERRRNAGAQAREIAERLAGGDPMVLFAEGSTGDGNRLLPFKSTLFGAAQMALRALPEHSVLVQPVALAYTRRHGLPMDRRQRGRVAWIGDATLWPHLKELLRVGALDVEVHFGEPLPFAEDASRKEVARLAEARVRAMMAAALRRPREP